jgi:aquaporin Z
MSLLKRTAAELFGTFWLVFAGCGTAIIASAHPGVGIGFAGVSLAFGLTVVTMAFAIGHISGCHLNPAVTIGLAVAKRFPAGEIISYIAAQVLGAIIAGGVLYQIASGMPGWVAGDFASNGYGAHSPDHYPMLACFLMEAICTAFFMIIILGATDERAPKGFAPLAIGLALALANAVAIPVTNACINPARALGPAIYQRGWALSQVWFFWVAPITGAIIGAVFSRALFAAPQPPLQEEMAK